MSHYRGRGARGFFCFSFITMSVNFLFDAIVGYTAQRLAILHTVTNLANCLIVFIYLVSYLLLLLLLFLLL